MAKTKVSEFDATAANNTDIDSINIAEGMAPSSVNNALRSMMSILKTEFFKTGTGNTSLGDTALDSLDGTSPGGNNTAIGKNAGTANTTGSFNVALGSQALENNSTANSNVGIGYFSLQQNTTGAKNVAVGTNALDGNTTGANNVAVGFEALTNNTTANNNTAVGFEAAKSTTTGTEITAVGRKALTSNTTGNFNTATGLNSLLSNTTGSNNVAIGVSALGANTTASFNTAVGKSAGGSLTTGPNNTLVGAFAGENLTTGFNNTFIGAASGNCCGGLVTTGGKNTIIGGFDGNQGGLDIRTANNQVVLSDGDGNPRMHFSSNGRAGINRTGPAGFLDIDNAGNTSASLLILRDSGGTGSHTQISFNNTNGQVGTINTGGSSTAYNTSSDYRLKENVVDLTGATDRLKQLEPKRFNFIADADTTVDGFLAHEVSSIVPEAITGAKDATKVDEDGNTVPDYQGIDQSKLVPLLVATIKELEERITALENA